jgi:hypothetical protein
LAAKNAPPTANKPSNPVATTNQVRPAPPKPKPAQSGTNQWLDSLQDVKIAQPEEPVRPKIPSSPASHENRRGPGGFRSPTPSREERTQEGKREGGHRGPGNYHVGNQTQTGIPGQQRPRQPIGQGQRPDHNRPRPGGSREGRSNIQYAKPKNKAPKPAQPKPKRVKTPPPEPFVPTPEQITQVEQRYLELATPAEFNGIRTQIAQEFSMPKKAVKKIIKDLRERQNLPSWWETQTYKGSAEELEKIKEHYLPMLPVPPVGVHKNIAKELSMKPGLVYQAIKAIRQEMNLPQYNDPTMHEHEENVVITEKGQVKTVPPQAQQEDRQPEQASITTTEESVSSPAETIQQGTE